MVDFSQRWPGQVSSRPGFYREPFNVKVQRTFDERVLQTFQQQLFLIKRVPNRTLSLTTTKPVLNINVLQKQMVLGRTSAL